MVDIQQEQHASRLQPFLEGCGYSPSNILHNLSVPGNRIAAIAGFAQRPFDNRSACFAAIDVVGDPAENARACRNIGAPITFLVDESLLSWWSQTADEPYQVGQPVEWRQLEGFFREHRDDFAPRTVYRAKTLGRFETAYQRTFVDLGLMPLLEKEAGEAIERLLLESVANVRDAMGWPRHVDLKQGQWLLKSVFWLLGAKMLHDKGVERFKRLNFSDLDDVFSRLVTHYGESADGLLTSQQKRRALEAVAPQIASSPSLQLATTEALAYVYENTLISKEIRAEFGTHSTPSYLVDYVVGRLEPWISDIEPANRVVFEPACGHAAFLVSSVRLLTSLLPPEMAEPSARKKYLRDRIRGYDIDDFAIEIARLSLTLTDIPNPNGWSVRAADLFESDLLERAARESMILLANTPFEDLRVSQRDVYTRRFRQPRFVNKTSELLFRALTAMPAGSVFGVVVPQSLLHETNATEFRKMLVEDCELQELCLFPDNVFNFADQESAVIIGRKLTPSGTPSSTRYRRVREREMPQFCNSYNVTSEIRLAPQQFQSADDYDLRIPDLETVWQACVAMPKLDAYVEIGQGFSHIGEDRPEFPPGAITVSDEWFEGAVQGFQNLGSAVKSNELPPLKWLNVSDDVLLARRSGTVEGTPQILLNEAPVQRAPWCLRAMIDREGRPAMSPFTILRPRSNAVSLDFLWALMNSPVANAFAYSHSSKRHILTGTWRKFPAPRLDSVDVSKVESAVKRYFDFVNDESTSFQLQSHNRLDGARELHWHIDLEILRLYDLPVHIERQLLDYFNGWERAGVPFEQPSYIPEHFSQPISLSEFLCITSHWETTNRRREELIRRKGSLSQTEGTELRRLQRLAGLKRELLSSPSLTELLSVEADLRRRKLWRGQ